MNPKHILVASDLSDLSFLPLEQVPELFENRVVTLLSVVPDAPMLVTSSPFAPRLDEQTMAKNLEEARASLERAAVALPNSKEVNIEVIPGPNSGEAIAHWAQKNGVDLITISTHGRTGFKRLVLGSVAEVILRHATVPVLVFPAKLEPDGEFD